CLSTRYLIFNDRVNDGDKCRYGTDYSTDGCSDRRKHHVFHSSSILIVIATSAPRIGMQSFSHKCSPITANYQITCNKIQTNFFGLVSNSRESAPNLLPG